MAIDDHLKIENMLYGIGPAAFKEISDHYYRQEAFIERKEKERIEEKNINTDYCVDYMNDMYMCGEKYVYGWRNQHGDLIYIGQGVLERTCATNKSSRCSGFNEHSDGALYLYFFAKRVSKGAAIEIEKMLIQRCALSGIKLANARDVLTDWEKEYFEKKINNATVDDNNYLKKLYDDYEEAIETHKEVVRLFDVFLDTIQTQTDFGGTISAKAFVKPDRDKDRRYYWTIDGVTKPAVEWCKKYGRSYGNVVYRMEKFGISLEQALTLPNVQYSKKKGNSMQQWKAMGLL